VFDLTISLTGRQPASWQHARDGDARVISRRASGFVDWCLSQKAETVAPLAVRQALPRSSCAVVSNVFDNNILKGGQWAVRFMGKLV
jgi:hypothetical protein